MKAKTRPYKNGQPRKSVGFRFPADTIAKLQRLCEQRQQSQSDLLIDLIDKAR